MILYTRNLLFEVIKETNSNHENSKYIISKNEIFSAIEIKWDALYTYISKNNALSRAHILNLPRNLFLSFPYSFLVFPRRGNATKPSNRSLLRKTRERRALDLIRKSKQRRGSIHERWNLRRGRGSIIAFREIRQENRWRESASEAECSSSLFLLFFSFLP